MKEPYIAEVFRMARRQPIHADIEPLAAELRALDKLMRRGQPDGEMNRLLAQRRRLTALLARSSASLTEEGLAKLAILCARLAENLAPYDAGGRLDLRLARSIQRDLKRLLQP